MIYQYLLIFVTGLFIGSFLNVCIYRYNTGLSVFSGRSKCFSCGRSLRWFELIPVFSFIIQGGKCRTCQSKISPQYILVEIFTGLVFALVLYRQLMVLPLYSFLTNGFYYWLALLIFYLVVFSILIVIFVYDIKHKVIPDGLVFTFIVLSLAKLLFFTFKFGSFNFPYLYDLLAPIIAFLPFAFLWVVSRGFWIGFGDAKLAFGVGALLGFSGAVSSIVMAFWIGAGFSIIVMLLQKVFPNLFAKKIGLKSEIPFAPFIIVALILVFVTKTDVLHLNQVLGI
jgi:leader peptidase (prepilin peptidase)/N-methyltransferase